MNMKIQLSEVNVFDLFQSLDELRKICLNNSNKNEAYDAVAITNPLLQNISLQYIDNTALKHYFKRGCLNYTNLQGNQALIILRLNPIINRNPSYVHLLIGGLLAESGNLESSLEYFERYLRDHSVKTEIRDYFILAKAEIHRLMGRYKSSRSLYGEITTRKGEVYAAVLKGMASTHKIDGDFRNALDCLNALIREFPNNNRYHFSRAHLYHHAAKVPQNLLKAARDYKKSISLKSWHVGHLHLALIYGHSQKYNLMADQLVLSVMGFIQDRSWHNDINLGLAYILQDRASEGLELTRNSLAFLGIHEVKCSSANVRSIFADESFQRYFLDKRSSLQAYQSMCEQRINELSDGASEYRRLLPLTKADDIHRSIQVVAGSIAIKGFTAWATSDVTKDSYHLGQFAQQFIALCMMKLRDCASFVKFSADGITFVSRVWSNSESAILEQIDMLLISLADLQRDFSLRYIEPTQMQLSFALVCGEVTEIHLDIDRRDYIGHRMALGHQIVQILPPNSGAICVDEKVTGNSTLFSALTKIKGTNFQEIKLDDLVNYVKVALFETNSINLQSTQ